MPAIASDLAPRGDLMTLATDIAAKIRAELPGWSIVPAPVTPPDNLPARRIYLQAWRDGVKVDPASVIQTLSDVTFRIMTGSTPSPATDQLLSDALDQLMTVLHDHAAAASWGSWEARYAIFPNSQGTPTYPGYEISFPAVPAPNPYRKKRP